MTLANSSIIATWFALALSATVTAPAWAQGPAVDPVAVQILQRMTDYVGGLQQFSVHTENTIEDLLESGQRIDESVAASVTVARPDKLRAERNGDLMRQAFYYDGKTLTLYSPSANSYATVEAPAAIEPTLDYASASGDAPPAGR